ncbi:MAG: nitronate monooxygenase [Cardiobacteriaceae bacterium]|nr:nitronate monooxygenase [Cardiobacteriaceae bacterium]
MSFLNNPVLQDLRLQYPLWQAPLPFGAISVAMTGKISAQSALGLLRLSTHETLASLDEKVKAFQKAAHDVQRLTSHTEEEQSLSRICPSFCFAHPLPKAVARLVRQDKAWEVLSDYFDTVLETPDVPAGFQDLLDKALSYQPKVLGFMHGMPSAEVLEKVHAKGAKSFVICHSVAEALVADRLGVDILVLQGLEAGGERCGFQNDLPRVEQPAWSLLQQVRRVSDKPLILWGDFSTPVDMLMAMMVGAQGVMLDRWFMACEDNGLPESVRERVVLGNECQSALTWQYTHAPMRCLKTKLTEKPLKSALGEEALFELGLKAETMPLPISLSAIEDPHTLKQMLENFQSALADYVVEG